jgi:hypothetical protein
LSDCASVKSWNIKAKEKYGREKYLMKAANEDIYVIKQQENISSVKE